MDNDIITTKELKKRLDISNTTLVKYKKLGMPYIELNPIKHMYKWSQIEEWLKTFNKNDLMVGESE